MPVLNTACPICTEAFQNADDIYTTSCGHIFHFVCMRDWQSRATSCPQCRSYNPTTHKLYLSFDDTVESSTEINQLKAQLQSSAEKIQELYDQIREADVNFLHLQEQCTTSEELIRELEERTRQSNDSETNFLHLQGQYTESEDLIKELQDHIQLLMIDNESKSKELNLKSMEIATLKTSLEAIESQASEVILADKIKILEQKLKHLSAEFEKEITNSTQLSIDKMKLQSYVDRMKLEASAKHVSANNSTIQRQEVQNISGNRAPLVLSVEQYLANKAISMGQSPLCGILASRGNNLLNSSVTKRQTEDNNGDDITSVVVKDYPLNQISYPLENIIITLATEMDLSISKEDFCKVKIMEQNRQRQLPKKVTLLVEFKTLDLKVKFLSNKNRLKKNPATEALVVKEYIDNLTYSVFVYANKKLRGNGFQFIFCKNNQVIAKKYRNDPKGVRIYSKTQVDELLLNNASTLRQPDITRSLYEDKADESFYKI